MSLITLPFHFKYFIELDRQAKTANPLQKPDGQYKNVKLYIDYCPSCFWRGFASYIYSDVSELSRAQDIGGAVYRNVLYVVSSNPVEGRTKI